jgi:hypothetical protein
MESDDLSEQFSFWGYVNNNPFLTFIIVVVIITTLGNIGIAYLQRPEPNPNQPVIITPSENK